MENQSGSKLFSSFARPDLKDWIKVASSEIAGADPVEKLQWKSGDITFLPLYTDKDSEGIAGAPFVLSNEFHSRAWHNMPEVVVDSEDTANKIALEHLQNEADGVIFNLGKKYFDIDRLINGISWEHCMVSFIADNAESAASVTKHITRLPNPEKLNGALFTSVPAKYSLPAGPFHLYGIIVSATASPQEQLTDALLKGVQLLGKAIDDKEGVSAVFPRIAVQLPISENLLTEVAKLKALRVLWAQVAHAYGIKGYDPNTLHIHGYSSRWAETQFQPHGNMLKGTIAAIAGISGGCNAITIAPEDQNNTMMRRVSRNVSQILREEAHLSKVNDPFAGSYAVEVITNELAKNAWGQFQARI